MLDYLGDFINECGILRLLDPCLCNVLIKDMRINIYEQKEYSLSVQKGTFMCYRYILDGILQGYLIIQKARDYVVEFTKFDTIHGHISNNICIVDSICCNNSEFVDMSSCDLNNALFSPSDILRLCKKNDFKLSNPTLALLKENSLCGSVVTRDNIPDISDKFLFNKNIDSSIWSNDVMIKTHESDEYYATISNGFSFVASVCDCYISHIDNICNAIYMDTAGVGAINPNLICT